MANPYSVKTLILSSGERLPVLLNAEIGIPLFEPTIYSLTQLRGRNLACNTIDLSLRHLMVFFLFLDKYQIDMIARLKMGQILNLSEIEALTNFCNLHLGEILIANEYNEGSKKKMRVTSLERFRQKRKTVLPKCVNSTSAANRMRVIADYLNWLVCSRLLKLSVHSDVYLALNSNLQIVIRTIKAHIPSSRNRNTMGAREGLSPEECVRLLVVTSKESNENPWASSFVIQRNELLTRWLIEFGLRRGDILNAKVSDIDFRSEELTIVRRADDSEDTRIPQPLVKTRDRIIPMHSDLCHLTYDYVVNCRRLLPGAKKHNFLFVADRTGAPMSLSALNKCFVFLRSKIADLPDNLSPHVLRHTWNDRFSEIMDKKNISDADEQKIRNYTMGWSDTSKSALYYTKRHIREKANEVSLDMQARMTGEFDKDF